MSKSAKLSLGKLMAGIHNYQRTEEGVGEAHSSDEGSNDSGAKGPYCKHVSKQWSKPIGNYYGTERKLWHCYITRETGPESQTGAEISVLHTVRTPLQRGFVAGSMEGC